MGIRRWAVPALAMLLAVSAGACSGGSDEDADGGGATDGADGAAEEEQGEIVIGASLPLTGERSESGEATRNGYELWQDWVNEEGGLLGREVRMVVQDDGGDLERVRANYQALIDRDQVDLLLGTYSGLLNEPASAVAEQNEMLFVCPACGAPNLFERDFQYFFFAQPAVAADQGRMFAEWVAGLPEDERPATAAYPTMDDPFTSPVVVGIREILEEAGVETVYEGDPYPEALNDFASIASDIQASGAELVAQGSLFADGVGLARAMMQIGYTPQMLFQTVAPSLTTEYVEALGSEEATEGVFYAASWSPDADFARNAEYVERYQEQFGTESDEDAASAFGTAQVLQAAVEGVGSIDDQLALADWLRANEVETIQGPISWDERGAPQQSFLLAQWQGGRPEVVLPEDVASTDTVVVDKPDWG